MVGRFLPRESPAELRYRHDLIRGMHYELVPVNSVDDAIAALPAGTTVSVTCSPVKGIDATLEMTARLRALGHRAVPHLAARMVESPDHVTRIGQWLRTEGVDEIFVVGGDADPPIGPFADALTFLRALLETDPGVRTVGVTAYPDGHPAIAPEVLDEARISVQPCFGQQLFLRRESLGS